MPTKVVNSDSDVIRTLSKTIGKVSDGSLIATASINESTGETIGDIYIPWGTGTVSIDDVSIVIKLLQEAVEWSANQREKLKADWSKSRESSQG